MLDPRCPIPDIRYWTLDPLPASSIEHQVSRIEHRGLFGCGGRPRYGFPPQLLHGKYEAPEPKKHLEDLRADKKTRFKKYPWGLQPQGSPWKKALKRARCLLIISLPQDSNYVNPFL
ncbi:MAG: hypothetical protein AB1797_04780 [bacterium]